MGSHESSLLRQKKIMGTFFPHIRRGKINKPVTMDHIKGLRA